MKNFLVWTLVIIAAAIAAWFYSVRQDMSAVQETTVVRAPVAIPTPAEPTYPIEAIEVSEPEPESLDEVVAEERPPEPSQPPLPALDQSDEAALAEADAVTNLQSFRSLLQPDFLIARLVATVDSLSAARVAPLAAPTVPVPGRFSVLSDGEEAVISPQNAERYRPYVEAIAAMDVERAVASYVRYYPLFQEAFTALESDTDYFNDRVIEVIDELLATPQPQGLIEVVQNEAVWEFKDPELEALTAGQKAVIRLGEDQGAVVRAKLREFREALSGAEPVIQEQVDPATIGGSAAAEVEESAALDDEAG